MLAIISPAKTLDYKSSLPKLNSTQADLLSRSKQLIEVCRKLSPQEIGSLMKISDKLAGLNAARFTEWQTTHNSDNSRPAVFAFKGDVYTGLDIATLDKDDVIFAQQHLRILSGLYGLLRPLDLMQPYRLEMGTRLKNSGGDNLYQFWGNSVTELLNETMQKSGQHELINLASDEYYKVLKPKDIKARVIKPIFLDCKSGKYKVISFYAKKARGLMCRYMIEHRLTRAEQLKVFDSNGYYYVEAESTDYEWIFKRDEN